ncbi:hypothetical protein LXL04_001365 [Taraxacum kok-saghyz]
MLILMYTWWYRKRRDQRKSPVSLPVTVLDLDEDEGCKEEIVEEKKEQKIDVDNNGKKDGKSMKKEHALTDFVKNSLVQ